MYRHKNENTTTYTLVFFGYKDVLILLHLNGDCRGQNQDFLSFKYCLGHVLIIKMIFILFLLAYFGYKTSFFFSLIKNAEKFFRFGHG